MDIKLQVVPVGKYLHVEFSNGGLYLYLDDVRRFKLKTAKDLGENCSINTGSYSIPVDSLISGISVK